MTPLPLESMELVAAGEDAHALAAVHRHAPDRHPAAVYLARLAPGSRRTMQHALDTIAALLTGGRCNAETLDWTRLRYQHTTAVRTVLAEKYAPAMVNKMICALRGVLKEAWRLGHIGAEEYHRAADVPPVRGSTLQKGRALSIGELRALFAVCASDKTPAGARDAAMLAVLYGAGLRRAELAALDLLHYSPETQEIRVHRGKGRKARVSYAPAGCAAALANWIAVRGDAPGPLFCPINKGGRLQGRAMTAQSVCYILCERAKEAGVAAFSPHDLRRTFIGDLLEAGADIATVQKLAGHASVQTTARYDRRGEATRRKAVDMLKAPFRTPDGRGHA